MKKLFILFIMIFTLLMSCSKQIDKNIIVNALSNISSVNVVIGNTIDYEVRILSKNNIDYNFEDLSFDDRDNKCRIISVENKTRNVGEYKERIIKYKLGFYDVGQFVVYPFKISYNYNNEYRELHGEDITILVYPFSDGETLPPMKGTIGIPMPKYVWLFVVLIVFAIIGIIILIFAVVKYIERKFPQLENLSKLDLWFSCMYSMQLAIQFLTPTELKNAQQKIDTVIRSAGAIHDLKDMGLKQKVWYFLSKISFEKTCRLRNFLKVGL